MTPDDWQAVDLMCSALRSRCAEVLCVTCGGRVPIAFDVRREGEARHSGPSLAEASGHGFRVVALRHERFCSFRCGMIFVQARLRRDGPHARIAAFGFRGGRR